MYLKHSQNKWQIKHPHQYYQIWKFCEDRYGIFWDIRPDIPIFDYLPFWYLLKLRSYCTKAHQISAGKSSALLTRSTSLRYFNSFGNTSATNEDRYANFADFASKIGCYGSVT